MGKRSPLVQLPEDISKELDRRIRACGFGEYEKHSEWLKNQGYEISKSAVHRYGKKLEQIAATPDEQELLDIFRQLGANDRHALKRLAQIMSVLADKEKNAV